jgi:hypothetical protein
MRKFLCVLLSAVMFLSVDAWGAAPATASATAKVKKAKKCLFPKSRKRAPTWVCDAKVDGLAVTALGLAAKSGAGISFMEQMAAADARTHLAQNLRGSGQKTIARSANAANKDMAGRDSALKPRITDESLQGTKVIKKVYGPNGTLYVLVGLDEASAQKLRESATATSVKQSQP